MSLILDVRKRSKESESISEFSEVSHQSLQNANEGLLVCEQDDVIHPHCHSIVSMKIKPTSVDGIWIGGVEVVRDAQGRYEIGEWMSANSVECPDPSLTASGLLAFRCVYTPA